MITVGLLSQAVRTNVASRADINRERFMINPLSKWRVARSCSVVRKKLEPFKMWPPVN
ncbi:hypothetical protein CRENPOLYSF1_120002 [Crenothrix polyspora]|uniref:Uncharacterized protein n=1 Tax=Crenothrix polyspora TaxID=360316 RepID=A0A1R4H1P1_9GAMM|nr:hypothetical protein CRENPOLYSF1_120002 [Crenothrix polyspora]